MATNAYFQPYEYYENGTIVGIDVDVATAICDTLGMTLKVEDMEFDSIITAVSSGKADVGIAGMTVTPERQKILTFQILTPLHSRLLLCAITMPYPAVQVFLKI